MIEIINTGIQRSQIKSRMATAEAYQGQKCDSIKKRLESDENKMLKISQMKDVGLFTCDSVKVGRAYICIKRTYKRKTRELLIERVPIIIHSSYEPKSEITGVIMENGKERGLIFYKNNQTRGLFVAEPDIIYANHGQDSYSNCYEATSISYTLMRDESEWDTLEYVQGLAGVMRQKLDSRFEDSFGLNSMGIEELERLRGVVWEIERRRSNRVDYKGFTAGLDCVNEFGEWECSFFDEYGKLTRFIAKDFDAMRSAFEKRIDMLLATRRYRVDAMNGFARITDTLTGEKIKDCESELQAALFIKNNLAKAAMCGKIATGEI